MEKEIEKLIEESKSALETLEHKVKDAAQSLGKEAEEYGKVLQDYLEALGNNLKKAYNETEGEAELKGHLLMMEAEEKMQSIQKEIDTFLLQAANKTKAELDVMALKAHLAKLESQTLIEEKQKELSSLYSKSKIEAEKAAQKALHELNSLFLKLTDIV